VPVGFYALPGTGRNGDVEQRHYRFKQAAAQALMMRGSHDFPTVAAYQLFLNQWFTRLNAGRGERYLDGVAQLRPLPERRLNSVRRERVRVNPGSLVTFIETVIRCIAD